MSRCDYCDYRNSWDCGDGYGRVSNEYVCDNFKLDFNTLTDRQKQIVQEVLMREGSEYEKR